MNQVSRITIERAEGPSAECGTVVFENSNIGSSDAIISRANLQLKKWALTAPKTGGYDKCDVVVEWGTEYRFADRLDLKYDDRFHPALLQTFIKDALTFNAGIRRPAHMSPDRYNLVLREYVGTDGMLHAAAMLQECGGL